MKYFYENKRDVSITSNGGNQVDGKDSMEAPMTPKSENELSSGYSIDPFPCYSGIREQTYSRIRFFHTAVNYGPVTIIIGSKSVVNGLKYSRVSRYVRATTGFKTVTITSQTNPRTVLLRKTIPFYENEKATITIINTTTGIDLLQISDRGCADIHNQNLGCFRVANLSFTSPPVDVVLEDNRTIFSDVRFKEVTQFKQTRPGEYNFYIAKTDLYPVPISFDMDIIEKMPNINYTMDTMMPEVYTKGSVNIKANQLYTAYMIGNHNFVPPFQLVILTS